MAELQASLIMFFIAIMFLCVVVLVLAAAFLYRRSDASAAVAYGVALLPASAALIVFGVSSSATRLEITRHLTAFLS